MKYLEVRTTNTRSKQSFYNSNLSNVVLFMRHDEDKIIVKNSEVVEIEVYKNGELTFSGDKTEFYNKLKS